MVTTHAGSCGSPRTPPKSRSIVVILLLKRAECRARGARGTRAAQPGAPSHPARGLRFGSLPTLRCIAAASAAPAAESPEIGARFHQASTAYGSEVSSDPSAAVTPTGTV